MSIDVEQVRTAAASMCVTHPQLSFVPQGLLRILDAFEAMERERWFIDISPTLGTWYAMDGEGSVISEGHASPLAALLAAAEQTKENRDG